ncbi:GIDE domain-containing protein [Marinobacterium weihaiense]|uniref:RING-type E3 ubiquitin transferase n=1 Tax=Marinobacterium weihaiense TaxID=2851016 RepID=A0ABS6MA36_9GAMM|nr:GIDE domain-containing protein [Marinobacterium weihaiense]MBV0932741.1 hypothetical protein [Marinobacterium weihaiense]
MLLDLHLTADTQWLLALLCLVAIAVALWFVFSRLARYRLIADTPTARIRSAPQGYVELIGHVIAGEDGNLRAPLSGRPCAWYAYRVEELDDDGRTRWRLLRSGRSNEWFQINDGTGTCLVDPDGAEISTLHKHSWRAHTAFPAGLEQHPQGAAALLSLQRGEERYRFTEWLILEHEAIYALGHFHTLGGGRDQLDLNQAVRERLSHWKQDPEALLARFDHDGDGRIDLDEWQTARETALQEAQAEQQALHALPSMHVLRDPQQPRKPYLLSTHDETRLMLRFRLLSAGCFLAALIFFWLFIEVMLAK